MKFSILLLAALSGVASFPISFIKNVNALKCIRNYAFSSPKLDVYRFRTPMKTLKISSEDKNYVVEGPFQGQYGLWYVDSRDAEVSIFSKFSRLCQFRMLLTGGFGLSRLIIGICNFCNCGAILCDVDPAACS